MNLGAWYKKRGVRFISERARKLNERYGLSPEKSIQRIERCVAALEEYDCHPTFAVPGIVVRRNLPFIRSLQDRGVEIAVHGYNHVDLKIYPPENAYRQLLQAADLFRDRGIEVHGFRCPYLSVTDQLVDAIPAGIFEYSSNRAIEWPVCQNADASSELLFRTIQEFYVPSRAETNISVPWNEENLVEIPVCVPDDLQLHDGLGQCQEDISQVWSELLRQIHRRGELFNLMFHPELASFCELPFVSVLEKVPSLRPAVWIAQLRDIGSWWKEKSTFRTEITEEKDSIRIAFICSGRATILARGLDALNGSFWDGHYQRLHGGQFTLPAHAYPFIGLPSQTTAVTLGFLGEQGYLVETGERAADCGIYIDERTLAGLTTQVQLINYIEASPGPLIRLWRWPDGYKSAMCITGDLDALSLLDYASRLFVRAPRVVACT